jgi:hypothetical protein
MSPEVATKKSDRRSPSPFYREQRHYYTTSSSPILSLHSSCPSCCFSSSLLLVFISCWIRALRGLVVDQHSGFPIRPPLLRTCHLHRGALQPPPTIRVSSSGVRHFYTLVSKHSIVLPDPVLCLVRPLSNHDKVASSTTPIRTHPCSTPFLSRPLLFILSTCWTFSRPFYFSSSFSHPSQWTGKRLGS